VLKTPHILVVRLGAMGDVIHALPAAASLKQSFPHCRLRWVLDRKWEPILRGNPFVDELTLVDRKSLTSLLDLRRKLRSSHHDFAVDFQGLIKSALIAAAARPERIFGFHRSIVRERLAALFYSHETKPHSAHVVDQNLELVKAAGGTNIVRTSHIPEGRPEGELPDGPFILANPLAGWGSKQWPLEYFEQLASRLREECGMALVLNVSSPETSVKGAHMHVSGLDGLIHVTRRAAGVVGVDSGPLHLAAALEKPGVAIFGPTDPERNGPYCDTLTVLRNPKAVTSYKRRPEIEDCMRAISVDQVFNTLRTQLLCTAH
jgi:heptosyltransferase-1